MLARFNLTDATTIDASHAWKSAYQAKLSKGEWVEANLCGRALNSVELS